MDIDHRHSESKCQNVAPPLKSVQLLAPINRHPVRDKRIKFLSNQRHSIMIEKHKNCANKSNRK